MDAAEFLVVPSAVFGSREPKVVGTLLLTVVKLKLKDHVLIM